MPIIPPTLAPPYPLMQDILNVARARLNDAMKTPAGAPAGQIGGEIFSDNAIFTLPIVNAAYQRMQEFLASLGQARLEKYVILTAMPVAGTSDPGLNAVIDWTGFFDGQNQWPNNALPGDMISPMRLWERPASVDDPATAARFTPMQFMENGLQDQPAKQTRNYQWEWRNDTIIIPGSTVSMDIRIQFAAYLPDFVDVPDAPDSDKWYNAKVPIMRCTTALAYYIADEVAAARGDLDSAGFITKAEAAASKLNQRDIAIGLSQGEWTVPDIPEATGATPYDYASTIMNAVRVRMNRASKAAGDIVAPSQPFTQQCFNNGWRKFQEFLANMGYRTLVNTAIITIPATPASADPALTASIDWDGYDNGITPTSTPALPQDLLMPLKIQERASGMNALFMPPMEQMFDGLPTLPRQAFNIFWEWRNDKVYMPGATQVNDLQIRYAKYLGDLVAVGSTPWYLQKVQIARCQDPLSLYVCAEIALSRPDLELDPVQFREEAEASAKLVYNRDVRQNQRGNVRRQSRSGRLEGQYSGYGWGAN